MSKGNSFYTKELRKWKEIYNHREEDWIYRGQRLAKWPLETTLERMCWRLDRNLKNASKNEIKIIREFKRRYYQFNSNIPKENDLLEWLSIMQHYKAPTRLLDFSYSIFVAAYFALEFVPQCRSPKKKPENAAVWAINGKWAAKESSKLFESRTEENKYLIAKMRKSNEGFKDAFFRENPKTFAANINPFRLHERLTLQRGVFMCPGNVEKSFEKNLLNLPGAQDKYKVKKLIIPASMRKKAIEDLEDMNINRATLFPGLEGFAESLQVSIPKIWEP